MRTTRVGIVIAAGLLLAGVAVPAAAASASSATANAKTLKVGTRTLTRCHLAGAAAWCGSIRSPLDPTDGKAGLITIGFGWFPSKKKAIGTIVAQEGGPGYPSTGTAPDYVDMLGGLLSNHNLLVVDARGTGRSTPIDCQPLQTLPSPSPDFTAAVTACGNQLNHTFHRAGGGYVHASDLFTTANSARDLARVLGALKLGKVALYGDSYGTYFAQSFLSRYPNLLTSVVLDAAYEARDLDPWYTTTVTTARTAFNAVCQRAVGCPAGSSWTRIGQLAASLRAHPVSGLAVGTDAAVHSYTVDITALVNIVNDAGYDYDPYRQLDAAARAYLAHHDAAPLLRLYAQDVGYDYSDYVDTPASYYSDGLYMAVACTDYPQLFNMTSTLAARKQQLAQSIAALPANTFAPFTTSEWISLLPYTETYTGCLTWPAPTHVADPPVPNGVSMDATNVPVLILNGDLDSLTPAAGGAHVAAQIGPAAHAVVVPNMVHLVALDDPYGCGASLVQAFLAAPKATLDTSCTKDVPPVRAVPSYPGTVTAVTPATGGADLLTRRLAAVAVAEAGDALIRYNYVDANADLGLRGGKIHYDDNGNATLKSVRYTVDTTVSGTVKTTATGAKGKLTVVGPGGVSTTFTVAWGAGQYATATTGGLALSTPAP
jgi:pimeloyl-ACP methyl ester carboxylesterase